MSLHLHNCSLNLVSLSTHFPTWKDSTKPSEESNSNKDYVSLPASLSFQIHSPTEVEQMLLFMQLMGLESASNRLLVLINLWIDVLVKLLSHVLLFVTHEL